MSQAGTISDNGGGGPVTPITIVGNDQTNADGFGTNVTGSNPNFVVNSYGPYKWVVNPVAGLGTHTTIAAATAAASSLDTIFITQGTYTENVTLKTGINYFGAGEGRTTLIGKYIDNGVQITCQFNELTMTTNSDYCISLTGTSSLVILENCFVRANNHAAFNPSVATTAVTCSNCHGDLMSNTAFWDGAGNIQLNGMDISNSGSSVTVSSVSGGLIINKSLLTIPIGTTGTGFGVLSYTVLDTSGQNITPLVVNGSGAFGVLHCEIDSGSATGFSCGSGSSVTISQTLFSLSNVVAINSAGTLAYSNLSYPNTSSLVSSSFAPRIHSNDALQVTIPGAYPYTVMAQDEIIPIDTTSARTVNLPASPQKGQKHTIYDTSGTAATNNITIQGNGNNILNSTSATSTLINTNGGSLAFNYNGTIWKVI